MTRTATHPANLTAPVVPGRSISIRHAIVRHPVVAYVLLAWFLSWTYWLSMLVRGQVATPGGAISHFPGLFGPMVAAFVITAIVGGRESVTDLIGRMFRWRVGLRWYLLAGIPFGLFLLGVAVLAATGAPVPTLDDLASYSGLPMIGLPAVVVAAFAANGLGEEVGWRGFAQPRLEHRMSFLRASVVVAIVWAIWHVPSFPIIEGYRAMGVSIVPIFVFGLGSGAIVLGWLYDRSGGSILMAALFHLGLNMGTATLAGRGLPAALATTGVMIWAALIVVTELRSGQRPRRDATSAVRSRDHRSSIASVRDASVRRLLASRLHRLAGPGLMLITYRGRRSGRSFTTPVEYVEDGDRMLVLVAHARRKQWWRNLQEDPMVQVRVSGRVHSAVAVVEVGSEAMADLARYVAARPRAARVASMPGEDVVVVQLEVA